MRDCGAVTATFEIGSSRPSECGDRMQPLAIRRLISDEHHAVERIEDDMNPIAALNPDARLQETVV